MSVRIYRSCSRCWNTGPTASTLSCPSKTHSNKLRSSAHRKVSRCVCVCVCVLHSYSVQGIKKREIMKIDKKNHNKIIMCIRVCVSLTNACNFLSPYLRTFVQLFFSLVNTRLQSLIPKVYDFVWKTVLLDIIHASNLSQYVHCSLSFSLSLSLSFSLSLSLSLSYCRIGLLCLPNLCVWMCTCVYVPVCLCLCVCMMFTLSEGLYLSQTA